MIEEGESLAKDCLSAIQEAIEFAETCPAEGWMAVTSEEGWPVAAVVRHIAEAGNVLIGFAAEMAAGGDVQTTMDEIDAWNAANLDAWSQTTREEAIRLLGEAGTLAARLVRSYSPQQLASWHGFAIYGQRRTTARMAQGFAMHTLEHLECAREAAVRPPGAGPLAAKLTPSGHRRMAD